MLVDATLGLGGHSEAVLTACTLARVVGIDRDPEALALAGERLAPFGDRFTGVHAVYDEIPDVLATSASTPSTACCSTSASPRCSSTSPSAASPTPIDAPLDMRMDGSTGPTAADVLNTYSAAELARVLREYGEERFARKIAAAVVRAREARAVHHVRRPGRAAVRRDPGAGPPHRRPPRQAHLPGAADGGQRRARRAAPRAPRRHRRRRPSAAGWSWSPTTRWRTGWSSGPSPPAPAATCPRPALRARGHEPPLRLLTRGAEQADAAEVAANPRAASVRLRAVERIRPGHERSRLMSRTARRSSVAPSRGSPRRPSSGPGCRRPARRAAHAADAVRDPGEPGAARRRGGAAAVQHLDAAGLLRRHRAGGAGHRLSAREQGLQMELERLRDPQRVAEPAQRQGMVPARSAAFLDLETGEVTGDAGARLLPRAAPRSPRRHRPQAARSSTRTRSCARPSAAGRRRATARRPGRAPDRCQGGRQRDHRPRRRAAPVRRATAEPQTTRATSRPRAPRGRGRRGRAAARPTVRLRVGFVLIAVVLSVFARPAGAAAGPRPGAVRRDGGRGGLGRRGAAGRRAATSWTATASRWRTRSTG